MRGFVYPKTFRNVHRDPNSKFYVSKKDFSNDVYPEFPALSYLMIWLSLKWGFKLMLARWRSQPIKYRVRECQPITQVLQSIGMKYTIDM